MKDKYFIVQYIYWSNGCRMNHSFETFDTEFYQLSEVKAVADRVTANNKDGISWLLHNKARDIRIKYVGEE